MVNEAGLWLLHSAYDRLSVDQHLNCRFLGVKESKSDLIQTRGHSNHIGVVLRIPHDILWEGIDWLHLPRHSEAIAVQVTAVPHPARRTILSSQVLVDSLLFHELLGVVWDTDPTFDLLVHFVQSCVHVSYVYREWFTSQYLLDLRSSRAQTSLMFDFLSSCSLTVWACSSLLSRYSWKMSRFSLVSRAWFRRAICFSRPVVCSWRLNLECMVRSSFWNCSPNSKVLSFWSSLLPT